MLRAAFLALAVVTLAACGGEHCPDANTTPGHITFAKGPALTVRIADDAHERADGLMNVTTLPANEGMAFLFGSPTDATFWMKDTPLPLSVAFVSDGRIVAIRDMAPCTADPCRTYASPSTYTMAVEANRGWFADQGIEVGDRVESFDGPFCQ